jgi:hypothetical protein
VNKYTIIPSSLEFKSAPFVDQKISINLEQQSQEIIEYDKSQSIDLQQVYFDERQGSGIFRPTFKVNYIYDNTYTGTTSYVPFRDFLYYTTPEVSKSTGVWNGFPQYFEFDFYRPYINDQHVDYKAKSAYTYNWMYYISYAFQNDRTRQLSYDLSGVTFNWVASEGIPFIIKNGVQNGSNVIRFQCIAPHGLIPGEYVELSFKYNNTNLFQVDSLGNDEFDSEPHVFNLFNVGYTGLTFADNVKGTFKRVTNPENPTETKSEYYIRRHKILTNTDDCLMTKNAFERNVFNETKKFEYSSITPNNVSRVSQKSSSNSYNVTVNYDFNIRGLIDNQKRPISELFLTIVNRGYTGYFNKPTDGIGLKQGWGFNLSNTTNPWWDDNNPKSNTNIQTSAYTLTSGVTATFYYNLPLMSGDTMDGDFCEWNKYDQIERVVSPYYHKLKFNQLVFQTAGVSSTNAPGYYYEPHHSMTIRVFSDYIETGDVQTVDLVPSYSFYSSSDQQFRWREIYTYGFKDGLNRGVDYPFLNSAHYPFKDIQFRLIPEGINYNSVIFGINYPVKPLIDACE